MQHLYRNATLLLLCCLLLCSASRLAGRTPTPELRFTENRGQWEDPVKYRMQLPAGYVYLERDRVSWLLLDGGKLRQVHPPAEDLGEAVNAHAWRMRFLNAKPTEPKGETPDQHKENYFRGDDPTRWAAGVSSYRSVSYDQLWPGVGMRWKTDGQQLKYDLHVAPGAKTERIQLRYEGLERLYLKGGRLHLVSSLQEVIEAIPEAWQQIGGRKVPVSCEYRLLDDSTVTFAFPDGYDMRHRLVIDPLLIFSTYTGSFADNWGMTATYDDEGCLYSGGVVSGVGYPTSVGALQAFFAGGRNHSLITYSLTFECDMAIIKYSPDGTTALYSTYIGGRNNDQPISLIVNDAKELFIYGVSRSDNFPTTATAFRRNLAGPFTFTAAGDIDMVVLRLNLDGSALLGSTYIGGSGHDGNNMYDPTPNNPNSLNQNPLYHFYADDTRGEILLDDLGRVYVVGASQSTNFPGTAGHFQPNLSGIQDAVVFRMSGDMSALDWATYFGGTGFDSGYSIKRDESGRIYFVGGTTSPNLQASPTAWRSSFQSSNNSIPDGYVACLSEDGNSLVHCTYVGTTAYDQVYFLDFDQRGDVFVVGQTQGNYPAFGTVYNVAGGKQFITKLKPDLSDALLSMRFGTGNPARPRSDITMTAFLVDKCDHIYVSGWGSPNLTVLRTPGAASGSTFGLPVTSDAFQPVTNGSDFYLMVLYPDAAGLYYATFLGGNLSNDHVDGGTSRFDKNGIVYHSSCASCFNPVIGFNPNNDFPTTPDAFSRTDNSNNCNNGSFKFDFELLNRTEASYVFDTITTEGCAPYRVEFGNRSSGAIGFLWDFGDGSPVNTDINPVHVYTEPGRYQVRLVAVNSGKCDRNDTLYQIVDVFQKTRVDFTATPQSCSKTIDLSNSTPNGTTWEWDFGDGVQSFDEQPGQHTYLTPGSYTVRLVVNPGTFCSDTLEELILIPMLPTAEFTALADPCLPRVQLFAQQSAALEHRWTVNGVAAGSSQPFLTLALPDAGDFDIALEVVGFDGCTDLQSQRVTVVNSPTVAGKVEADHTVCRGQASNLLQLQGHQGAVFRWEFSKDDGQTWHSMGKAGSTSLHSGRLTATTWFRAIVQSGTCEPAPSEPARVEVSDQPLNGVLSGGQTICASAISPRLELKGHSGRIIRWERSDDGGGSWTSVDFTGSVLETEVVASDAIFRVLLDNGDCGTTFSPEAEIRMLGNVSGGQLTGGGTVCRGQASGLMTLADHEGEVLRWEFSKDDRNTWFSMGKGGVTALRSGRLTTNTWFRVIVSRAGCPEQPSEPVLVAVEDQTFGGAVVGGGDFCGTAENVELRWVGGSGTVISWENSTDGGESWNEVDHREAVLVLPAVSQNSRYRVVTGSAACGLLRSAETEIRVSVKPVGGRVEADHSVCRGQASEPLQLLGFVGEIKGWEFSKDDGQTWHAMGKAGADRLVSGRLTVTTSFRARLGSEFCETVSSLPVRVAVRPGEDNGSVLGGGEVCAGSAFPLLTWSLANAPILRWEFSEDDGRTWQHIAQQNRQYQHPGLAQRNARFRVIRADGICNGGVSADASVKVVQPKAAGTLTSSSATVCPNAEVVFLTLNNAGGRVLRWERKVAQTATWTPVAFTGTVYEAGRLSADTDFRAWTEGVPCPAQVTPALRVSITPPPVVGSLSATSTKVCYQEPLVAVSLNGTTAAVIGWEVRDLVSGGVQSFASASNRFELLRPTQSVAIRAELNGGGCGGRYYTPEIEIQVLPPLMLSLQGQGVCGGATFLQATASGGAGGPYLYILSPALLPPNASGQFTPLPSGAYTVEVRDGNGCRTSQTLQVDALIQPPVVTGFSFITESSATVSWTAVPGQNVRYELRYRIVGEAEWKVKTDISSPGVLLTGLQHSAQYEVEVAVLCRRPDGGFDRIPSPDRPTFRTREAGFCSSDPPAHPGGVYVNQITANSAVLNWSPIKDLLPKQGYVVSFGLTNVSPLNWPQFMVCHPDTHYIMQGFSPERSYGVRVRTNCSNCTTAQQSTDRRSAWSSTVFFDTPRFRQQVSSEEAASGVRLYPNPNRGGFFIETSCASDDEQNAVIFDLSGRQVWSGLGRPTGDAFRYEPDLAAGVYRLRLRYCGGEANLALIVH